jgi:methionyl-tRNA synthetase
MLVHNIVDLVYYFSNPTSHHLYSLLWCKTFQYGVDQTRFFLMSEVTFGGDGDFSHERMIINVDTKLANELGNLCQRTLTLVFKNCKKAVPNAGPYLAEDEALLAACKDLHEQSASAIANQAIYKYAEILVSAVWDVNKYIDVMAPWVLKKTDPDRMATVLYVLMEAIRRIAILYQPLIPSSANKILDQLMIPKDERTFEFLEKGMVKPFTPISKPVGVFPRIKIRDHVDK